MDLRIARQLNRATRPRMSVTGILHWGIVAAIHTSPNTVDVYLDGDSTAMVAIPYLASYSPTVGDNVCVLQGQAQTRMNRFVLGKRA